MPRSGHPTKTKLVDTAVELLKTTPRSDISTDLILSTSGISKGSLYHHFEDLDELIESAMLVRYTDWVDTSIGLIMQIIARSKTPKDIYDNLVELTKLTQHPNRRLERIYRAEILGIAENSPRLAERLGLEQQRLTNALVDIIRDTQENGYFKKELDPHAIAVLIQAYTLGKVLDDYSPTPVNPESWNELINAIVRNVFIGLD
jgi:AcrR family transcriptional regulator